MTTALNTAYAAQFRLVADSERGQRIQDRLDALRISDREFHARTGIDRKTLRRAVAGGENVRENTYRTIEDWLDRLERIAQGFEGLAEKDPADDLIEFRLSGNFGVDVVVKGPIRDQAALEASVARLIREMRARDE